MTTSTTPELHGSEEHDTGQPRPRRRRRWLRRIALGLAALVALIIGITVASSGTHVTVTPPAPAGHSALASPAAPAALKAPSTMGLAPGQSVTVSDTGLGYHGTVAITGAKVVTGPQAEFGSAPAHGYFVIATVKATAASGGQLDINPLDFYAKAKGQHIGTMDGNAMGAIDSSQELTASTLNGGETATGQIVFDVPSAHGQIVYAPGLNSQALASWNY
jgi:Domain of unknown function (DUF4352)